jgi:hypothetical protein
MSFGLRGHLDFDDCDGYEQAMKPRHLDFLRSLSSPAVGLKFLSKKKLCIGVSFVSISAVSIGLKNLS